MYAAYKNQNGIKSSEVSVSDAEIETLENLFAKLQNDSTCKSLLKQNLTEAVKNTLRNKKTSLGGTLADCIRSGCENTDSNVGIYASDPEAYDQFSEVFNGVICQYHGIPKHLGPSHPNPDFGDIDNLGFSNLDEDGDLVVSTRVRVGRSVRGFSFPPCLSNDERLKLEGKIKEALSDLDGELKGTYHPLVGMEEEERKELTEAHFLFNDSDRFLKEAGGYKDWPQGRGIYFSTDRRFLAWANEEDHMRIISMQKGGDLGEVYRRLIKAVNSLEKKLDFAHHQNLGYLTFCPTNLGTTLRASVHVKIPNFMKLENHKLITDELNLQVRGIHGEHTESVGGVYDVSNKRRMGLTELEAISEMARGVSIIILLEKSLIQCQ